jgi:hypothetical protein
MDTAKNYRVKYHDNWFDAEEYQHPAMTEPGFLIDSHVFNRKDFEEVQLIKNQDATNTINTKSMVG